MDLNGALGAVGAVYKNNPSLNYVGINSSVGLGLTPLLSRALPRASLTVTGSFQYTPVPPAFLNGNQDAQNQDPTVRGLQAFRTNTTSYGAGETFLYQFTPLIGMQSTYNYSKVHFGSQAVSGQGTGLLDTQSHSFGIGPTFQVSRNDTLLNTYTLRAFEQTGLGHFMTHSGTVGWRRNWLSNLSTQASLGAQYIEESNFSIGGQPFKQAAAVTPTATLAATYASRTELLGEAAEATGQLSGLQQLAGSIFPGGIASAGSSTLQLSYSYGAYPLFLGTGGLAKSHVVGLSGTIGLTSQVTAAYGATFARNTAAATGANFSIESYSLSAGLNYLIMPTLRASLNYSYSNSYNIGSEANSVASSTASFLTYNRQVVMFLVSYAFGGGAQFFQGGSYFGPGVGSVGAGTGSGIR